MKIRVDPEGNVTPPHLKPLLADAFAGQNLQDDSPPETIGWGFVCPDCGCKYAIEKGTPFDHEC